MMRRRSHFLGSSLGLCRRGVHDKLPGPSNEMLFNNTRGLENIFKKWRLSPYMLWPTGLPLWSHTGWAGHCRPFVVLPVAAIGGDRIAVAFLFDTGAPVSSIQRSTAVALGLKNIPPEAEWSVEDGAQSSAIGKWYDEIVVAGQGYTVTLGRGLFSNTDLLGADLAGQLQLDVTLKYRNTTPFKDEENEFFINQRATQVYASVNLPNEAHPVVTDVAATLQQQTVDGLRKALKKDLADELQSP